jgi:hypothetical protein
MRKQQAKDAAESEACDNDSRGEAVGGTLEGTVEGTVEAGEHAQMVDLHHGTMQWKEGVQWAEAGWVTLMRQAQQSSSGAVVEQEPLKRSMMDRRVRDDGREEKEGEEEDEDEDDDEDSNEEHENHCWDARGVGITSVRKRDDEGVVIKVAGLMGHTNTPAELLLLRSSLENDEDDGKHGKKLRKPGAEKPTLLAAARGASSRAVKTKSQSKMQVSRARNEGKRQAVVRGGDKGGKAERDSRRRAAVEPVEQGGDLDLVSALFANLHLLPERSRFFNYAPPLSHRHLATNPPPGRLLTRQRIRALEALLQLCAVNGHSSVASVHGVTGEGADGDSWCPIRHRLRVAKEAAVAKSAAQEEAEQVGKIDRSLLNRMTIVRGAGGSRAMGQRKTLPPAASTANASTEAALASTARPHAVGGVEAKSAGLQQGRRLSVVRHEELTERYRDALKLAKGGEKARQEVKEQARRWSKVDLVTPGSEAKKKAKDEGAGAGANESGGVWPGVELRPDEVCALCRLALPVQQPPSDLCQDTSTQGTQKLSVNAVEAAKDRERARLRLAQRQLNEAEVRAHLPTMRLLVPLIWWLARRPQNRRGLVANGACASLAGWVALLLAAELPEEDDEKDLEGKDGERTEDEGEEDVGEDEDDDDENAGFREQKMELFEEMRKFDSKSTKNDISRAERLWQKQDAIKQERRLKKALQARTERKSGSMQKTRHSSGSRSTMQGVSTRGTMQGVRKDDGVGYTVSDAAGDAATSKGVDVAAEPAAKTAKAVPTTKSKPASVRGAGDFGPVGSGSPAACRERLLNCASDLFKLTRKHATTLARHLQRSTVATGISTLATLETDRVSSNDAAATASGATAGGAAASGSGAATSPSEFRLVRAHLMFEACATVYLLIAAASRGDAPLDPNTEKNKGTAEKATERTEKEGGEAEDRTAAKSPTSAELRRQRAAARWKTGTSKVRLIGVMGKDTKSAKDKRGNDAHQLSHSHRTSAVEAINVLNSTQQLRPLLRTLFEMMHLAASSLLAPAERHRQGKQREQLRQTRHWCPPGRQRTSTKDEVAARADVQSELLFSRALELCLSAAFALCAATNGQTVRRVCVAELGGLYILHQVVTAPMLAPSVRVLAAMGLQRLMVTPDVAASVHCAPLLVQFDQARGHGSYEASMLQLLAIAPHGLQKVVQGTLQGTLLPLPSGVARFIGAAELGRLCASDRRRREAVLRAGGVRMAISALESEWWGGQAQSQAPATAPIVPVGAVQYPPNESSADPTLSHFRGDGPTAAQDEAGVEELQEALVILSVVRMLQPLSMVRSAQTALCQQAMPLLLEIARACNCRADRTFATPLPYLRVYAPYRRRRRCYFRQVTDMEAKEMGASVCAVLANISAHPRNRPALYASELEAATAAAAMSRNGSGASSDRGGIAEAAHALLGGDSAELSSIPNWGDEQEQRGVGIDVGNVGVGQSSDCDNENNETRVDQEGGDVRPMSVSANDVRQDYVRWCDDIRALPKQRLDGSLVPITAEESSIPLEQESMESVHLLRNHQRIEERQGIKAGTKTQAWQTAADARATSAKARKQQQGGGGGFAGSHKPLRNMWERPQSASVQPRPIATSAPKKCNKSSARATSASPAGLVGSSSAPVIGMPQTAPSVTAKTTKTPTLMEIQEASKQARRQKQEAKGDTGNGGKSMSAKLLSRPRTEGKGITQFFEETDINESRPKTGRAWTAGNESVGRTSISSRAFSSHKDFSRPRTAVASSSDRSRGKMEPRPTTASARTSTSKQRSPDSWSSDTRTKTEVAFTDLGTGIRSRTKHGIIFGSSNRSTVGTECSKSLVLKVTKEPLLAPTLGAASEGQRAERLAESEHYLQQTVPMSADQKRLKKHAVKLQKFVDHTGALRGEPRAHLGRWPEESGRSQLGTNSMRSTKQHWDYTKDSSTARDGTSAQAMQSKKAKAALAAARSSPTRAPPATVGDGDGTADAGSPKKKSILGAQPLKNRYQSLLDDPEAQKVLRGGLQMRYNVYNRIDKKVTQARMIQERNQALELEGEERVKEQEDRLESMKKIANQVKEDKADEARKLAAANVDAFLKSSGKGPSKEEEAALKKQAEEQNAADKMAAALKAAVAANPDSLVLHEGRMHTRSSIVILTHEPLATPPAAITPQTATSLTSPTKVTQASSSAVAAAVLFCSPMLREEKSAAAVAKEVTLRATTTALAAATALEREWGNLLGVTGDNHLVKWPSIDPHALLCTGKKRWWPSEGERARLDAFGTLKLSTGLGQGVVLGEAAVTVDAYYLLPPPPLTKDEPEACQHEVVEEVPEDGEEKKDEGGVDSADDEAAEASDSIVDATTRNVARTNIGVRARGAICVAPTADLLARHLNDATSQKQVNWSVKPPPPPAEAGGKLVVRDAALRLRAVRRPKTVVLPPAFSVRSNAMLNPGDKINLWPHLPRDSKAKKGGKKSDDHPSVLPIEIYYTVDKSEPKVYQEADSFDVWPLECEQIKEADYKKAVDYAAWERMDEDEQAKAELEKAKKSGGNRQQNTLEEEEEEARAKAQIVRNAKACADARVLVIAGGTGAVDRIEGATVLAHVFMVEIVSAKGVAKADGKVGEDGVMTGLSDPFCKLMWNGEVLGQTKPVMDCLDPVWAVHANDEVYMDVTQVNAGKPTSQITCL